MLEEPIRVTGNPIIGAESSGIRSIQAFNGPVDAKENSKQSSRVCLQTCCRVFRSDTFDGARFGDSHLRCILDEDIEFAIPVTRETVPAGCRMDSGIGSRRVNFYGNASGPA